MTATAPLPLSGLRVLDLTNVIAGPYCCYHLALMGAEVLKVEQPGSGDLARQLGADPQLNAMNMGASYLGLSAGKQAMTLNLKAEAGNAVFRKLAAEADVLVENFRPGVMARLGLDDAALRPDNPRLVYCAISGFGQDSPLRGNPAFDQIVQGLSGAMASTGDAGTGPMRAGYPVSDTVAGINAAFAICAALLERERTGLGQLVDVSMLDATISIMGWVTTNQLIAGQAPVPSGNDNFTASPSGAFRAADGLLNIAANKQEQFSAFCRVVGREDLLDDPRFQGRDDRIAHRVALKSALEEALAARPAAEWVALLTEAGVPAAPVWTLTEALAHPHVQARGTVQRTAPVPALGRPVDVFTAGWKLSGGAPRVGNPPPALGADTSAVLKRLGYSAEEIAQLRSDGVI